MKLRILAIIIASMWCFRVQAQKVGDLSTWINENAVVFDDDHLMAEKISEISDGLKGRRIVSMGEATHGTKDFLRFKYEVVKSLVRDSNFRAVGVEAFFTDVLDLNSFVAANVGSAESALSRIEYWMFSNEETLEFVKWVRHFNERLPLEERVQFYGIDLSRHLNSQLFLDSLKRYDLIKEVELNQLNAAADKIVLNISESTRDSLYRRTDRLRADLYTKKGLIENEFSKMFFFSCLQNLESFRQYLYARLYGGKIGPSYRDSCMAKNVQAILSHRGADKKLILSSHNGHVGVMAENSSYRSMGAYLREFYGPEYFNIGFDFHAGSFVAAGGGIKIYRTKKYISHSLGSVLSSGGARRFFITLRGANHDRTFNRLFRNSRYMRMIGASFKESYEGNYYIKARPSDLYDAIVFVDSTESVSLLRNENTMSARILQRIDIRPYVGKNIKVVGSCRFIPSNSPGSSGLALSVSSADGAPLFIDEMRDTPVTSSTWQKYAIKTLLDGNASYLTIGAVLRGSGQAFFDSLELYYMEAGEWVPIPVQNSGFEKPVENFWERKFVGGNYSVDPNVNAFEGNKSILIQNK